MARYAFIPGTLATFLVNLIPLYGVLSWGWDTFQLLMLYWIETVVVAFWTIRRLVRLQSEQPSETGPGAFSLAGFFTLHAGMFIGVHFIFLWALFSWDWLKKVHGVGSFFHELFVAQGVWVALLGMLILHWLEYLTAPKPKRESGGDGTMPVVGGLYVRIVIMQIAILGGAWISGFTGSLGPLVIVIVLKALLDLILGSYGPLKALVAASAAKERNG